MCIVSARNATLAFFLLIMLLSGCTRAASPLLQNSTTNLGAGVFACTASAVQTASTDTSLTLSQFAVRMSGGTGPYSVTLPGLAAASTSLTSYSYSAALSLSSSAAAMVSVTDSSTLGSATCPIYISSTTTTTTTALTGFFFLGATGYYANPAGQYCRVMSAVQWSKMGGPSTPVVVTAIPSSNVTVGDCVLPFGHFYYSGDGQMYWTDGTANFCIVTSWALWLFRGGPAGGSNAAPVYPAMPASMVWKGECGVPKGVFTSGGNRFYSNGVNAYCQLVSPEQAVQYGAAADGSGIYDLPYIPNTMALQNGACAYLSTPVAVTIAPSSTSPAVGSSAVVTATASNGSTNFEFTILTGSVSATLNATSGTQASIIPNAVGQVLIGVRDKVSNAFNGLVLNAVASAPSSVGKSCNVVADANGAIADLYLTYLGRVGDWGSMQTFTTQMTLPGALPLSLGMALYDPFQGAAASPGLLALELPQLLFSSAEGQAIGGGNAAKVAAVYQALAMRNPAPSEITAGLKLITKSGYAAFVRSVRQSVPSGATSNDPIVRLYRGILGREPDAAGLMDAMNRLLNGQLDIYQIMTGLRTSPEYASRGGAYTEDLVMLYRVLLGRYPTAGDLASWNASRPAGGWPAAAQIIMSAPEYIGRNCH